MSITKSQFNNRQNCYLAKKQDLTDEEEQVQTYLMAVPVEKHKSFPVGRYVPVRVRNVPCVVVEEEFQCPNTNNGASSANAIMANSSKKGKPSSSKRDMPSPSKEGPSEFTFQLTCDPNNPELECNKPKGEAVKALIPFCPAFPPCNFDTRKFGIPMMNVFGYYKGRDLLINSKGLLREEEKKKEGALAICFESC